jgi:hypothetical protein
MGDGGRRGNEREEHKRDGVTGAANRPDAWCLLLRLRLRRVILVDEGRNRDGDRRRREP